MDAELRRRIAEQGGALNISPAHVFLACTHTHGAPNTLPLRGVFRQLDERWFASAVRSMIDLVASLPPRLQPATFGYGATHVDGIGHNRQDEMCPIDEQLLVAALMAEDGSPIAILVNYATHPVILGGQNLWFTADYSGVLARALDGMWGGTTLFIQGCSGDVNPVLYRDRGWNAGTFADSEQVGRTLAAAAVTVLHEIRPSGNCSIAIGERGVCLPLDPPPNREELQALKTQFIADRGETASVPITDRAKAAVYLLDWVEEFISALDSGTVPDAFHARIAAARIGPLLLLALPFEVYSQTGIAIRQAMGASPVLLSAYTGGVVGYVPTDAAKRQGGYGPAQSYRFFTETLTPFGFGAADVLESGCIELLQSLMECSK